MKIKAILTGATGMVGEGVLMECLLHPDVEKVLVLGRRPCGISHPKLSEIIHSDFHNITPIAEQLKGYNACFFCLGVSSVGMDKERYYTLTYSLTIHIACTLADLNSDMVFCYVSGAGTDSTEKGKLQWARVKGRVENDLMKLPFHKVYNFRPGFIMPSAGQKNFHGFNALYKILYPVLRTLMPKFATTMKELGLAMINSAAKGYDKQILEVTDIITLSKK